VVRLSIGNTQTLANPVRIELYSMGQLLHSSYLTDPSAVASFGIYPQGSYELRVDGEDVEPQTQSFSIQPNEGVHTETVFVRRSQQGSVGSGSVGGGFVDARVPAKARNELLNGDAEARRWKWQKALQHYAAAIAVYPNYAAAYYRVGLIHLQLKQNDKAAEALKKSLEIEPDNPKVAVQLARVESAQKKFEEVERLLENVVAEHTENAEALFLLANAELETAHYREAVANARKAHGMPHRGFEALHLISGAALEAQGQNELAANEYRQFLTEAPASPLAPRAQAALSALAQGEKDRDAVAQMSPAVAAAIATAAPRPVLPATELAWAPPNVDDVIPAAHGSSSCPLGEVLHRTGMRVQELSDDLQQFTAAEEVEHSELNGKAWRHVQTVRFSYVAEIRRIEPTKLTVEEYRDGLGNILDGRGIKLLTTGMAAMAFVFHPDYVGNFVVSCEGETTIEGEPAWQVHFAQRSDVTSNFRGYWVAGKFYPIKLKGRAWISAKSAEVLRLETDLAEPIKDVLKREHMLVSYRSVEFPKRNVRLRLPETAEIYMDFRGRRYRDRHSFSEYQLFSVDTSQQTHLAAETSGTDKSSTAP
jgi:tetratricopeptide (TPR) repeat protein